MPELPEVETTRRGIAPFLEGRRVRRVVVRQRRLRWPVPRTLDRQVVGARVEAVERRAKYLLLRTEPGTILLHLGMTGSLRIVAAEEPPGTHDHVDLVLDDGNALRLRDPRRFGCVLWTRRDPRRHDLLRDLGPEPLDPGFDGGHLHRRARGRRVALKSFLMDQGVVVGVGNIYASESLFRAGIAPGRAAGRVSRPRYDALAAVVKQVLSDSIRAGGTTLRDFQSNGEAGYYSVQLDVYGRTGEPCPRCKAPIREGRHGQRSTFWCRECQS